MLHRPPRPYAIAITIVLALLGGYAPAASIDYHAFNLAAANHYLLPRYRQFAEAATDLDNALQQLCAKPDSATLDAARSAFHSATDAWMALQHVSFGPISLAFRAERINYWPERRNAVGRGLSQLLRQQNAAALEPQTFAQGSVAVQGLPALERLLFADDALAAVVAEGADFHCRLLAAIGANLAAIGTEVAAAWRDDMLPALAKDDQHPIHYDDPKAATTQLYTNLRNRAKINWTFYYI